MKNKRNMGITLIALVVTIIVLLILAGISIMMLTGDNGILQRATDAKTNTDNAQIKERIQLAELSARTDGKGDLSYSKLNEELAKEFGIKGTGYNISEETENPWIITVGSVEYSISHAEIQQVTGNLNADEIAGLPNGVVEIAKDDATNTTIKNNDNIRAVITGEVPIPNGFYYVGGTKDDGVVISDNTADSGKGTSHSVAQTLQGNQFVWVPVDEATKFVRSNWENWNGSGEPSNISSDYTENADNDPTGLYTNMYNSVINNKGFFVARYEAGNEGATLNKTYYDDFDNIIENIEDGYSYCVANWSGEGTVVSKQGKKVWNYISWGTSNTVVGNKGAVYNSQQMYSNKAKFGVTSTLIYGVQWDSIIKWINTSSNKEFIIDSSEKGFYSTNASEPCITGSDEKYAVKNIYDLAGNIGEWTMEEAYNDGIRVIRRSRFWIFWFKPFSYF